MRNRIEAGAAVGGLFLALAALAFNQHWGSALAFAFLGCAALAFLGAFANRIPIVHLLPVVGAPQLEAALTVDGRQTPSMRVPDDLEEGRHVLVCLGVRNSWRLDVEPAHVNFLMTEGIRRGKCDHNGRPDGAGRWMRPTSEKIGDDDPHLYKDYWADTRAFPGDNSVVSWFRLRIRRPGRYRFRLKISSPVLYKEFVEDFEIDVQKLEGEETIVEKVDRLIDKGEELFAALAEAHPEVEYRREVLAFIVEARMAIPDEFAEIFDDARGDWKGKEAGQEYLRGQLRAKADVLYEIRRRLGEGRP